ncbi:predicted protein [Pyrenophora tritici-repentis Pt-1C-BFP]|uniref:Uncharacterized protein n=1 Tax=Pyrenophora tritici-repentis (strain Pt-1C-BFP) TaxID=426418 RepID=B2WB90_PYRTR|nr:uncharacterized protein PTRG_06902 [Pyrenophora tritici-repentis Pt-1C-BFP]EDU49822.1 predicted protein [Pyrenophora tritici-repentis Pt-1C-BFP]
MAPCVPQTWGTGGTFHQGNKANLRPTLAVFSTVSAHWTLTEPVVSTIMGGKDRTVTSASYTLQSNLGFAGNYTKVRTGAAYICSPQAEPPGFSASLLSIDASAYLSSYTLKRGE